MLTRNIKRALRWLHSCWASVKSGPWVRRWWLRRSNHVPPAPDLSLPSLSPPHTSARARYANYYLAMVQQADPDRPIALEDLAQALEAWEWVGAQPDVTLVRAYVEHFTPQLEQRGLHHEIVAWAERDLSATRTLGDDTDELFSLLNLGRAYDQVGMTQQSIECYMKALPLAKHGANQRAEGVVLGLLGSAYQNIGDYNSAKDYFSQALAHAQQIQHGASETVWGSILGHTLLNRLNDMPQAVEHYKAALVRVRETADPVHEVTLLCDLAEAHAFGGDLTGAQDAFEQALKVATGEGHHSGEAKALLGLATVAVRAGDKLAARKYHERILEKVLDRTASLRERVQFLGGAGLRYADIDAWQYAAELHEQQLSLARQIADPHEEGLALAYKGQAFHALGQLDEAEQAFKAAVALMQQVGDRYIEGRTLLGLARLYGALGRQDASARYYESVRELAQILGDTWLMRELASTSAPPAMQLPAIVDLKNSSKQPTSAILGSEPKSWTPDTMNDKGRSKLSVRSLAYDKFKRQP